MFIDKGSLACFYTSHEFFYRPYSFQFNILSSFDIIAKTLSVALEYFNRKRKFYNIAFQFLQFKKICILYGRVFVMNYGELKCVA